MSQQIQTFSITAPGFYGLNTQDSSLDLASGFALTAVNCVIDQYGRVGARKGWVTKNTTNTDLGSANVEAIGQLVTDSGVEYTIAAGNNKLFKLVGSTLTMLTYGGGGTAPTISASNWQIAALNECLYLFQAGHDPLVFDPAVSTTTYRRVSEKTGYTGTVPSGNIVLSAYGRLWVADLTTEKAVIYWSDILSGHKWANGSTGSIDVSSVWPNGADNITGLASHNGFLFIFGKNNILVYSGAQDVLSAGVFKISDSLTGIGCIARDTIQNTGSDVIFLSDTGVRSVLRTIQEKSAPFRDLSKNVRNDLMSAVAGEVLSTIKSVYSPFESFYLLSLPSLKTVYCFDMKATLQDGSSRVTTWDSIDPKSFCYLRDKSLLIGKAGYIGQYSGYQDNGNAYRFQYFTNHTDLGTPMVSSVLKKLSVVVIGGSNQYVTIKWGYDFKENYLSQNTKIPTQGVAEFGISEYNITGVEYSDGISLQTLTAYPTGAGKVIQTGYEADINGSSLSIQKLEIQAKNGKIL
jgi:hypothetical protein